MDNFNFDSGTIMNPIRIPIKIMVSRTDEEPLKARVISKTWALPSSTFRFYMSYLIFEGLLNDYLPDRTQMSVKYYRGSDAEEIRDHEQLISDIDFDGALLIIISPGE